MTPIERSILCEAAEVLSRYRSLSDVDEMIVGLSSVGPNQSCSVESVTVSIKSLNKTWTGNAVYLEDAVSIARGKVADEKERRRKEKEKKDET